MVKDMLLKRFDLTKDLRNLLNFAKSFMERKIGEEQKRVRIYLPLYCSCDRK